MIPSKLNPMGINLTENLPLTLTAEQANSTVKLTATGSPTVSGLHYRLGKSGLWIPYTIGYTITLAHIGDCVQFGNSADTLSSSGQDYVQFVMTGSLAGSGNIQSMLNWSASCPDFCFFNLFVLCSSLTSAPELPSIQLGNYCYRQMFLQSSITAMPELLATVIGEGSYRNMFGRCYALAGAVNLPAQSFTNACYETLLQQTAITEIHIQATGIFANNCMNGMLNGCASLSKIEVNFTSWGSIATATQNWVDGVAADGTFIKPSALPEEYGVNRIPTGWTVVNK